MWTHFVFFFVCRSHFQNASNSPETRGGSVQRKGPLNVEECTFAKHHTKQGPNDGQRREEKRFVRFPIEDGINYAGLKQTIPENQGLFQRGHSKSASHETITTQRTRKMSARVLPRPDLDPPRLRRSPASNSRDSISNSIKRSINQNQ